MALTSDSHSVHCAVAGDLTSTTAPQFRELLEQKFRAAPVAWSALVLDLRRACLVDSVGLNLLVGTVKIAKARGATVQIIAPHPMVRRILSFTRVDRHAEVVIG